jgi:TPR repeat protein
MAHFGQQIKGSRAPNKAGRVDFSAPYNRSLRLIDHNDAEAFRLNHIAAEDGIHDAVLAMGWFYLNGVGVKANEDEAIRWYRRSARQGEPRAMFSLGYIAHFRKDYSEALKWFEQALRKNHHRSGFWLGKMYWRGRVWIVTVNVLRVTLCKQHKVRLWKPNVPFASLRFFLVAIKGIRANPSRRKSNRRSFGFAQDDCLLEAVKVYSALSIWARWSLSE